MDKIEKAFKTVEDLQAQGKHDEARVAMNNLAYYLQHKDEIEKQIAEIRDRKAVQDNEI